MHSSVWLSSVAHGWHSRGKLWFLVLYTFLLRSEHMNTHTETPPARPPGLDDPLNSSNYQALTDRQIKSEHGACTDGQKNWQNINSYMTALTIQWKRVRNRRKGNKIKRSMSLITACMYEPSNDWTTKEISLGLYSDWCSYVPTRTILSTERHTSTCKKIICIEATTFTQETLKLVSRA